MNTQACCGPGLAGPPGSGVGAVAREWEGFARTFLAGPPGPCGAVGVLDRGGGGGGSGGGFVRCRAGNCRGVGWWGGGGRVCCFG